MAGKVKPIPNGCHTVTPHLTLKDAAGAIEFYKRAFGAEELYRMAGPDGRSIMHAHLRIGDSPVFLNDEFCDQGCTRSPSTLESTTCAIHLYVENADAAFERATRAGAEVVMPLMNMFWGDRYGIVKDPAGHVWSIASHVEDVPPDQMQARMIEAMKEMEKGGCKQ